MAEDDYEGTRSLYDVDGESITRKRTACPKCGPGTFLADHDDRKSCGKCGYTEFQGAGSDEGGD